jgi:hypothetical protein
MDAQTRLDLPQWLAEYSQLSKEYQAIAAPKKAQIKAIEMDIANTTAHLSFRMNTLEALIRPAILETKQSEKCPYVHVVYSHRDTWNKDMLFAMAEEVPAIMQAYEDASTVQFRKTGR